MEINIISFLAIVGLGGAFVFNTLSKTKILETISVYRGYKWFVPNWIPFDCDYCISFWICVIIGIVLSIILGLPWYYYFLSVISHQITKEILI